MLLKNKFIKLFPCLLFIVTWSCDDLEESRYSGFMKIIDIGKNDLADFSIPTKDGGFLVLLRTDYSSNSCVLIKTDKGGNILWEKRIFPYSPGSFSELKETSDGGYIMASYALTKTDSTGIVQWSMNDPNTGYRSVIEIENENFVAITVNGLIKNISSEGQENWVSDIRDHRANQQYYSIGKISDGGYIVAGFSGSPKRIRLIKCEENGSIEWSKYLFSNNGNDNYFAYNVSETIDGGFIIGGEYLDQSNDQKEEQTLILVKTTSKGKLRWYKKRTTDGKKTSSSFTIESDRGDLIVLATTKISTDEQDIWLIKFDSDGKELWNKFYETNRGWGSSVQQTLDGGFIISGSTQAYEDKNNSNALLIRTDKYGNTDSASN